LVLFLCIVKVAFAQVATPEFLPDAADAATPFDVTITCATAGAAIRFTKDGTNPTSASEQVPVNGKVHIDRHVILKARAYASDQESAVKSAYYRVTGAITAGGNHAMGLKSNETLWSWGMQDSGRLGNGNTASADQYTTPQSVKKLGSVAFQNAVVAEAGHAFNLVIDSDGKAWAFGDNVKGQLGDDTTADAALAKRVLKDDVAYSLAQEANFLGNSTDGPVTAVSAGYKHSLAVEAGKVWGWGERANGRIGDTYVGASSARKWATEVQKVSTEGGGQLGSAAQVAAGKNFSLALCSLDSQGRGQVWAWGNNANGALCLNSTSPSESGTARKCKKSDGSNLDDVVEITAGWDHAVTIRQDNAGVTTVWCWGERLNGRLGDGGSTTSANITYPVQVRKLNSDGTLDYLTNVVQVSAGPRHSLALDSSGKVWAWGNNSDCQLGDPVGDSPNALRGTGNYSTAWPVRTAAGLDLTGIVAIAAGGYETYDPTTGAITGVNSFSLAVHENGTIYGWGYNAHGQLATGNRTTPYQYATATGFSGLRLSHRKPTVTVTQSGTATAPATITLTAVPVVTDAPISRVNFFQTGVSDILGFDENGQDGYQFQLAPLNPGAYTYSAIAIDTLGEPSLEASVSFTISKPTVSILSAPTSIVESGAPGNVVIKRDSAKPADLTVRFTLTGTAIEGADFVPLLHEATIPAGFDSVTVPITACGDTFAESTETVIMTLVADANDGYTLSGTIQKTIQITDRPTITVVATRPNAIEGSGPGIPGQNGVVTFFRDSPGPQLIVNVSTGGTAPANTFSPSLSSVTFPNGVDSVSVTITRLYTGGTDDAYTLTFSIGSGSNYIARPELATINILDYKQKVDLQTLLSPDIYEPGTGTLRITRNTSAGSLTVPLSTSGTATLNTDYQLPPSVVFGDGVTSLDVPINVLDDENAEPTETIVVASSATAFYDLVTPSATFNIINKSNRVATPTITPNGGSSSTGFNIVVNCATPDVALYFTLSGRTIVLPTDPQLSPGGTLVLTRSAELRVKATKPGLSDSIVASAIFLVNGGNSDSDQDGLTDIVEITKTHTDPADSDTNEDGLSDGEDVSLGLNPVLDDLDGDGINNYDEQWLTGTHWWEADSDRDGVSDGIDPYPLDPTRWDYPPPPNPADTTPPNIQLLKPFGIVLQDSP
jgi:alpha-tubulin suppressor-like RCC1 family protein